MGSHSNNCTCTFHFTGPPEKLPNKLTISTVTSSDCGVDAKTETKTIEVPSEVLSDHLLLAFSKLDPQFTFNLPETFFDQNIETYQRNVEGFLELIRLCLLQLLVGQSESLTAGERNNINNTQDDLSGKRSAPRGSEEKNGYGNVYSGCICIVMMATTNELRCIVSRPDVLEI